MCVCVTAAWIWGIFYQSMDPLGVSRWSWWEPSRPRRSPGHHLQTGLGRDRPPIYALLEGLVIGGISSFAEAQFPGIVIQAVGLTFGTCLALLLAYKSRLIQAAEGF